MKTRSKAFTLIELLVVVAIIALLISILLPSLSRARELSKRATCAANLHGIAHAMYIYAQDGDKFPALASTGGALTTIGATQSHTLWGYYRTTQPTSTGVASVSADLWYLVYSNASTPKQFICPSTADTPDPTQDTLAYFDFKSGVNLSYAYQFQHEAGRRPVIGTSDDPTFPLCADSNPYCKGGVTSTVNNDRNAQWRGNSTNHTNREGENTLFVDSHVDFTKGPDNGLSGNIGPGLSANIGARRRDNQYTIHSGASGGGQVDPGLDSAFAAGFLQIAMGDKSEAFLIP